MMACSKDETKTVLAVNTLKKYVSYDPLTGEFVRLVGKGAGQLAGSINKYRGYVYIRVNGKRYMAHRLAWLYVHGNFPVGDIDHIDQVKHNNVIANLRDATKSTNQRNRPVNDNSASRITGVYYNGYSWVAQITVDKKVVYLGSYNSKEDACMVRQVANKKYEFSKLHGKEK